MTIVSTSVYLRGSTYKIQSKIYDDNDVLVDPVFIKCTITDPNDTEKSTGDMAKSAEGIYVYFYDIATNATIGKWKAKVTATDGLSHSEVKAIHFIVD